MTLERFGIVKFRGQDVTVLGEDLKAGHDRPGIYRSEPRLGSVPWSGRYKGKVRIIAAFLSVDTDTCDRELHRFNQEAAALSKDIAILVISNDLPFAQKRWCGAAGVDQVSVLSDHMTGEFGLNYGLLVKEARDPAPGCLCGGSNRQAYLCGLHAGLGRRAELFRSSGCGQGGALVRRQVCLHLYGRQILARKVHFPGHVQSVGR